MSGTDVLNRGFGLTAMQVVNNIQEQIYKLGTGKNLQFFKPFSAGTPSTNSQHSLQYLVVSYECLSRELALPLALDSHLK
jgi:hypothetical protein